MKKYSGILVTLLMLMITSMNTASAAKLNSRCSEIEWLKGTVVKIGGTKAQCVAGPDDYYWIAKSQISADAAVAGPQENKRRAAQKTQTTTQAQTVVVPNILGWPSNAAETKMRQSGLRTVRLVRGAGGNVQATCAMSNAGIITWMSVGPGYKVPLNTLITIHSSC
ncbi:hypothetical protein MCEMRE196_00057 [Candidatus Nanopelagicaceae bacterium]